MVVEFTAHRSSLVDWPQGRNDLAQNGTPAFKPGLLRRRGHKIIVNAEADLQWLRGEAIRFAAAAAICGP